MKTIKTIIELRHLEQVLELLDELGLLKNTTEMKDPAEIASLKKIFKNKFTYLITTCTDQQKNSLVGKIFPVIAAVGGICMA